MNTLSDLIQLNIAPDYMIEHCQEASVRSLAAVTCNGWVFTFEDGSELTVDRGGIVIEG